MTKRALLVAFASIATAGCSDSCIAAGVWVTTPRGRTPIELLRVGDRIMSVDPIGGEMIEVTITAIRSATRECIGVELGTGERLVCTPDHPVFDPETGTYRDAGDWVLGKASRLLAIEKGEPTPVEPRAARAYSGLHRVFDLTVDGPHHNFVANGVVVHNKTYYNPPEPDTAWFEDVGAVPCPVPLPAGEACLTVEGKEFHMSGVSALLDLDQNLYYTFSPADGSPMLELSHTADGTRPIRCDTSVFNIAFPTDTLDMGYYGGCTVELSPEQPMAGATVSGTAEGVAFNGDDNYSTEWEFTLAWESIPVDP